MRIIFIENIDPNQNNSGGIATYINKFSQYLIRNDIDTVLIGSSQDTSNKYLKIEIGKFINITNKKVSHFKFIIKSFLKGRKIILQRDDVIFGQRLDVVLPFVLFHKKNRSVCISHGNQSVAIKQKKGRIQGLIFDFFEKKAISMVDLLLTVDEKTQKYFQKKYPEHSKKISVIPIGIDKSIFYPMSKLTVRKKYNLTNDDKIVMYIGRLDKEKNLFFLIDSFREVLRKVPFTKLIFIGSGRQEKEIKRYAKNQEIKNIQFWGVFDNAQIPELINCADVTVLCSLFEGSPTVTKESLACNVPVVSTDIGDVELVIKKIPGCYLSENNTKDFSNKIVRVLNNPNNHSYNQYINKYRNTILFEETLSLICKIKRK